ncbi:MAG: hypothetical protein MJ069_04560 [Salinivirgaceae bacterium]|nr:hypothetical protein [Salinivirgaceae bacterium]
MLKLRQVKHDISNISELAENRAEFMAYATNPDYTSTFDTGSGGFLAKHNSRIPNDSTSKNDIEKYEKEIRMCDVFVKAGHKIVYKEDVQGEYDVLFDGIPADLKQTKGTGNIEKYARYAVKSQKAKMVLFCLEKDINRNKAEEALRALYIVDKIKVLYYYEDNTNVVLSNKSLL